jgi:hypothetical protein
MSFYVGRSMTSIYIVQDKVLTATFCLFCYEIKILQQVEDVRMIHKHVSYKILEVIFAVTYLKVVVV